jgi:hypothetical protein
MRFVTLLIVAACGGGASEVAVKGPDLDLARLAGDWLGDYHGTESGRQGPIHFQLQLGQHTADGTVLMGGANPLKIQFISISHDKVSGKIDPYTDPQCQCQVQTEFDGTVAGNAIEGTFTTKVIGKDVEQHGSWSVKRTDAH